MNHLFFEARRSHQGSRKTAPRLSNGILPLLLLLFFALSAAPAPADMEGTWRDEEGGGVIQVYESSGKIYGRLLSADDPEEQKQIEGKRIMILEGFEKQTTGESCCGTIFLVRFNLHIPGTLSLLDDSTLLLKGKVGPFSKSRTWKRM